MTIETLEIIGVAIVFLLIGYLMRRPNIGPNYPASFFKKQNEADWFETDPYQEAMRENPTSQGTIEQ